MRSSPSRWSRRSWCRASAIRTCAKPAAPQVGVHATRLFARRPPVELAEASTPVAREAVSEIEGMDLAELLGALGGNRAVLDKLLARFELECGQTAMELERALE